MEKKMAKANGKAADGEGSGYTSPSNQSAPLSPSGLSGSSATSVSTSSKPRFDGAHFFAGHADALVPKQWRNPSAGDITALEEKLKAVTKALATATKEQGNLARELSHLRLEKEEVETTMGMELQSAEETIVSLEKKIPRVEGLESQLRDLQSEKKEWERTRTTLKEREKDIQTLKQRLQEMETRNGEATGMKVLLAETKDTNRRGLEQKDAEIQKLNTQRQTDQRKWDREKSTLEDERLKAVADLEEGLSALRTLAQTHDIVIFSRQTSMPGIVSSIGSHLAGLAGKIEGHGMVKAEWESTRKKLEEDVRNGQEKREALYRDVEEARREREDARNEARALEVRLKVSGTFQR
jgi:chromosome segregation ATPase